MHAQDVVLVMGGKKNAAGPLSHGATRHEAAATVIGRRAQGHEARRREGVNRARPEDRNIS